MKKTKKNQLPNFKILIIFKIIFITIFLSNVSIADIDPDLSGDSSNILSKEQEKFIGEILMSQLRGQGKISTDAIINEYITNLGNKLLENAPINQYKFKFYGANDPILNAFAFFDGHVVIHTGLITATSSESELAAVMAHEISHITQKHISRMIEKNKRIMPVTLIGMIGGAILTAVTGSNAGMQIATASAEIHHQQVLSFSREHEKEADRIGMTILSKSGFNPNAMADIFEKMKNSSKYNTVQPEYLLTHPLTNSRITDARHRASQLNSSRAKFNLNYELIKARAVNVNAKNNVDVISYFKNILENDNLTNKDGIKYGLALAYINNKKFDKAYNLIKDLTHKYPSNLIINLLLAQLYTDSEQSQKAIQLYDQLSKDYPNNAQVILPYSSLLIELDDPKPAKKLLNRLKYSNYDNLTLFENLGKIESLSGRKEIMHLRHAEYYLMQNDIDKSLQQLELAIEFNKLGETFKLKIEEKIKMVKNIKKKQNKMWLIFI